MRWKPRICCGWRMASRRSSGRKPPGNSVLPMAAKQVVVTLGPNGFCCLDGNNKITFGKGAKVDSIDATGAGDGFLGAMTARLAAGGLLRRGVPVGKPVCGLYRPEIRNDQQLSTAVRAEAPTLGL